MFSSSFVSHSQVCFATWEGYGFVPFEFDVSNLFGDTGQDDALVALDPVGRGGEGFVVRELEGVHDSQDFVEVSSAGRWVGHHQLHFLVWADDEHGSHRHGHAGARIVKFPAGWQHIEGLRNGTGLISNDWEAHGLGAAPYSCGVAFNVGDPGCMRFDGVTGKGNAFDVSIFELLISH